MDVAITADVGWQGKVRLPVGTAGSVAFHAALLAALFLFAPLRSFVAPPEPSAISVDIIPLRALEPVPAPVEQATAPPELTAPARAADGPADSTAAPQSAVGAPSQGADGTFHATKLYAATMLTQPSMAQVRLGLTALDAREKVMQLCNIEALEQIRLAAPQYDPDTMVSYAMADPIQSGLMLTALGGAFRSRRLWYGVSFECAAAPALDGVTSFSFKLGDAIPRDQWDSHSLNDEDANE